MEYAEHYASYQNSVRNDALAGFSAIAQAMPTADPIRWPTVWHYLSDTVDKIRTALKDNERFHYREHVRNHQECLLALFEKMAEDAFNRMCSFEGKSATVLATLEVINLKGWNWFRFLKRPISFEKQVWVPRHVKGESSDGRPIFDARELKVMFDAKPSKEMTDKILAFKKEGKILHDMKGPENGPRMTLLEGLNRTLVYDWTQELFP